MIDKAGVLLSHLSAEGRLGERIFTEAVPFRMEICEGFSTVYPLWSCDDVSVWLDEKIPQPLHHPQTWVHVRVSLLIPLPLLSQTVSALSTSARDAAAL